MDISKLSDKDKDTIYQCLKASCYGPFFPEPEFHTLFGMERKELESIIENWNSLDKNDHQVEVAVVNSMNNLIGYPHGEETIWGNYISVSPVEVEELLDRLLGNQSNYFGRMK